MHRATLTLEEIRPYHGNPRFIDDVAIERVAASIDRYGYQAPIIVDKNHTVVAGHVRLAALRKLGKQTAEVLFSDLEPTAAMEYRVVDNRTGEMATWDRQLLATELRAFTSTEHLEMFFPEVDLGADFDGFGDLVTAEDIEKARDQLAARAASHEAPLRDVVCPQCEKTFQVTE